MKRVQKSWPPMPVPIPEPPAPPGQPSWTARLPTLASERSQRSAIQKWEMHAQGKTRVQEADKAAADDVAELAKWGAAVKTRDKWRDRYDGQKVLKTIKLTARRAEAHHHEPRENKATRTDVRNGITLALENHSRIKAGTLKILPTKGSKYYTAKDGKKYLSMSGPIAFDPPAPKKKG